MSFQFSLFFFLLTATFGGEETTEAGELIAGFHGFDSGENLLAGFHGSPGNCR